MIRFLVPILAATTLMAADPAASPLLPLMPRFAAAEGVDLAAPPLPHDPSLPGKGYEQHSLLYVAEWSKTLQIIHAGKIIWTMPFEGKGEWEDAWMLSNGNVQFARLTYAAEVTPEKQIVWRRDVPKGRELATLAPLGLDRIAYIECGKPPTLVIEDKATRTVLKSRDLDFDPKQSVHPQFRRLRVTTEGTFLVAYQTLNKVVEYDQDLQEIWSYAVDFPSAVVALSNGNRLIVASREVDVREVTKDKQVVWSLKPTDLPEGLRHRYVQTVTRLANGNTILATHVARDKPPQLVEVTRDKQVVWMLRDWDRLAGSTAVQVLEEPGLPEQPGVSGH